MHWLLVFIASVILAANGIGNSYVAKPVTDVEADPYRNLNYDVPNTYYMDEEDKPKKCSCMNCTWER